VGIPSPVPGLAPTPGPAPGFTPARRCSRVRSRPPLLPALRHLAWRTPTTLRRLLYYMRLDTRVFARIRIRRSAKARIKIG